jgi:hypothetical protein
VAPALRPAAVTAVVCLVAVGIQLARYDGDATGFVQFGSAAAAHVEPPPDAHLVPGIGYDGQFYWVLAEAPWIDDHVKQVFAVAEYRAQRIAFPALAAGLAGGRTAVLPWSLLALNLAFAVVATMAAAAWLRGHGRSEWLALAVGLTPGVLMALLRDLPDAAGLCFALAGLWLWHARRPGQAAAALAAAVLARETMLLAVAAIALDALRRRGGGKENAGAGLVLAVPLAAFAAWQAYATWRFGGTLPLASGPGSLWAAPGVGLVEALPELFDRPAPEVAWSLLYVAVALGAVAAALLLARRRPSPVAWLAAGFGVLTLLLGEAFWVEHWSFTRATAPLLAFLLLAGAAAHDRAAVALPCAAAVLTALIPVAL